MTLNNLQYLLENKYTGYEKSNDKTLNPLIWELGHISLFYDYHLLKYLYPNNKHPIINNWKLFDSFIISKEDRFLNRIEKKSILNYFKKIYYLCNKWLNENIINNKTTYLFLLSILHNHMHIESIIYTKKKLNINNNFKILKTKSINAIHLNFIKINKGSFYQGTKEGENLISFDNEKPKFKVNINEFYISDIPITNCLYLNFIVNGGYIKKDLWCDKGWKFIIKNKINSPLYWKLKGNLWYEKLDEKYIMLDLNQPVCHISWYEAKAIATYMDCRLPKESEWEFVATNNGTTKYPWGDKMNADFCNINYSNGLCHVYDKNKGNTLNKVKQMIGNIWEWCEDSIYPYNGFNIDPIYKEFSYPYFGFKKILKGGCWAVPEYLINTKYRNAQLPENRIQFTGVRLVKDN